MAMARLLLPTLLLCGGALLASPLPAADGEHDLSQRQELRRTDLSGSPGMEVITSVIELHKGEGVPRHLHHGVETGYVLQGSRVQYPGKEPVMMETGTPILNARDAVHSGFIVVGDEPLRLLTVHVVDKGQPLYDWAR
jgi:quercetin dioxygenase-like cupin family protein